MPTGMKISIQLLTVSDCNYSKYLLISNQNQITGSHTFVVTRYIGGDDFMYNLGDTITSTTKKVFPLK